MAEAVVEGGGNVRPGGFGLRDCCITQGRPVQAGENTGEAEPCPQNAKHHFSNTRPAAEEPPQPAKPLCEPNKYRTP